MPVKPEFNPDYLYFVTTTAEKHAHLFQEDVVKRIILDSFHFLRTAGRMNLYAFVIMPNHVHFIARFSANHSLSDVMRDFKRHTARQIILQYQAQKNERILSAMHKANHDRKQEFKAWQDGYDAREVFTLE